jgi:hypothetical protein
MIVRFDRSFLWWSAMLLVRESGNGRVTFIGEWAMVDAN